MELLLSQCDHSPGVNFTSFILIAILILLKWKGQIEIILKYWLRQTFGERLSEGCSMDQFPLLKEGASEVALDYDQYLVLQVSIRA